MGAHHTHTKFTIHKAAPLFFFSLFFYLCYYRTNILLSIWPQGFFFSRFTTATIQKKQKKQNKQIVYAMFNPFLLLLAFAFVIVQAWLVSDSTNTFFLSIPIRRTDEEWFSMWFREVVKLKALRAIIMSALMIQQQQKILNIWYDPNIVLLSTFILFSPLFFWYLFWIK